MLFSLRSFLLVLAFVFVSLPSGLTSSYSSSSSSYASEKPRDLEIPIHRRPPLPLQISRSGSKDSGDAVGELQYNTCWYSVRIKTSCSSTRRTRDAISLSFGDAYGYQVYAPRLDDPSSGAFERCSTDTYRIQGPCTYRPCYLYLRRDGRDGWTPESVTVSLSAPSTGWAPVTFKYGTPLPNGVWWGFNLCGRLLIQPHQTITAADADAASSSSSFSVAAADVSS